MQSYLGSPWLLLMISLPPVSPGSHYLAPYLICCSGGSAKAAGELVQKLGGVTIEYLFIIEIMFLKGYQCLDAPAYSVIQHLD